MFKRFGAGSVSRQVDSKAVERLAMHRQCPGGARTVSGVFWGSANKVRGAVSSCAERSTATRGIGGHQRVDQSACAALRIGYVEREAEERQSGGRIIVDEPVPDRRAERRRLRVEQGDLPAAVPLAVGEELVRVGLAYAVVRLAGVETFPLRVQDEPDRFTLRPVIRSRRRRLLQQGDVRLQPRTRPDALRPGTLRPEGASAPGRAPRTAADAAGRPR